MKYVKGNKDFLSGLPEQDYFEASLFDFLLEKQKPSLLSQLISETTLDKKRLKNESKRSIHSI